MREAQSLVQSLAEVTRSRHAKYGNTVFHLEPNVKDRPGGLRDYNVACWLAVISAMDKLRDWPEPRTLFPISTRKQLDSALDFLMSVRCFLHLRQGRDDNLLLWESQDEAAARRIGTPDSEVTDAAGWMRIYFGRRGRCIGCANSCSKRSLRHGHRSIVSFSTGGRGYRTLTFPSSTGSSTCNSPTRCTTQKCCCARSISSRRTACD